MNKFKNIVFGIELTLFKQSIELSFAPFIWEVGDVYMDNLTTISFGPFAIHFVSDSINLFGLDIVIWIGGE